MESALYLIEANQPVYPLDLTRSMRDQRASMIQTGPQYKFVCQAILQVYKEGKVKPSPEFCQTTTSNSISVSSGRTTTNNNNPPSVTNIVTSTTQAASTWKRKKTEKIICKTYKNIIPKSRHVSNLMKKWESKTDKQEKKIKMTAPHLITLNRIFRR